MRDLSLFLNTPAYQNDVPNRTSIKSCMGRRRNFPTMPPAMSMSANVGSTTTTSKMRSTTFRFLSPNLKLDCARSMTIHTIHTTDENNVRYISTAVLTF